MNKSILSDKCQVCGATNKWRDKGSFYKCQFCNFKKITAITTNNKEDLIYADNINQFFKDKYNSLNAKETFPLTVPVRRFYNNPTPKPGQINFFTSKNIMFLLEQHGFLMVSRTSRFSNQLSLTVRKV